MENKEKTNQSNQEKIGQFGCCDFTSEETQGMFKMMRDFCGGSEKGSGDCRSMMKEMMKNMSSKSDDRGCAEFKSKDQKKSNNIDANVESGCC